MECKLKKTLTFTGTVFTVLILFTLYSTERLRFLSMPNHDRETQLNGRLHAVCVGKISPLFANASTIRDKPRDSTMTSLDVRKIQKDRIRNVRRVCSNTTLYEQSMYNVELDLSPYALFDEKLSQRFYFSPKYKFIYCKVPKVGSTFWSQAFEILHNFGHSSTLLEKGRNRIHEGMVKYYSKLSYQYKTRYPAVIPARNPYTRLFSAFVDKSYLNLIPQLNQEIGILVSAHLTVPEQNGTKRLLDATFQEFLDFIVLKTKAGHKLDRHWATIVSLCVPCNLNVKAVIAHETNKQDVEYAMNELGIVGGAADAIKSLMYENRTRTTVPGIIKTAYKRVGTQYMSRLELVRRLWKAFQYQGFIRACLRFPGHLLNETTSGDFEFVTRLVLDTIERNPMSSAEVHSQRRRALVEAYSGITKTTLEQIRQIYETDFKMFDYSQVPPI